MRPRHESILILGIVGQYPMAGVARRIVAEDFGAGPVLGRLLADAGLA